MSEGTHDLARAIATLRSGGLVAFPTETVYGLGADADNPTALRRVFDVKGRPANHPLIVHVGSRHQLPEWTNHASADALRLADAFWPGPLTLILERSARVLDEVTGGAKTVGLRVPAHPVALALLREHGGGIAAPSANRFGAVSPTTAQHVRDDLGDAVDVILDGGDCGVGVESTIVDVSAGSPTILRPGGVSREQLEQVLGRPISIATSGTVQAPGMLPSHYAPRAEVVVVEPSQLANARAVATARGQHVGVVHAADYDDLEALARRLYAQLRTLDAEGCDVILVTLPPDAGLGLAIADRLRKAAGPRGISSLPER